VLYCCALTVTPPPARIIIDKSDVLLLFIKVSRVNYA
jgi:hypothetical protein